MRKKRNYSDAKLRKYINTAKTCDNFVLFHTDLTIIIMSKEYEIEKLGS